jgi:hypothetical protein
MDPLHLVVWIIAAIVLAGILGLTGIVVIDLTIARRLRSPMRRHVLSLLVLSVGFVATRVTGAALGSGIDELNPGEARNQSTAPALIGWRPHLTGRQSKLLP